MSFLTSVRRSLTPTVSITGGKYNDTGRMFQPHVSERIRNAVIAGNLCAGRTGMIESVLNDAVNSNFPVIYIRDGGTDNAFVQYFRQSGFGHILDLSGKQGAVNLFKGFDVICVKELLLDMMEEFIVVDDPMRDFCDSYFNMIFECLRMTRQQFRMNLLVDYTPEWLEQNYQKLLNAGTLTSQQARDCGKELLDLCKMFQRQIKKFKDFTKNIAYIGLDDYLSGSITIPDVYASHEPLIVTLDSVKHEKSSRIILRLLVEQLKHRESVGGGAVIVFEDCGIKGCAEQFLKLMEVVYKQQKGCVYFTEQSIRWWNELAKQTSRNKSSMDYFEHPSKFCNTYFVFRQNDPEELCFWAAMSGACKKWKESHHQAPIGMAYHMSPLIDLFFGHIMVDAGRGYNEVDTTNIEKDQFSALPESSCMVIMETFCSIYNCKVNWC